MGRGRHSVLLAQSGFAAFGVDVSLAAIREAMAHARREGVLVRPWCADLTEYPLPPNAFELVLVTRYLQRDLFEAIRESVVPGGFVIYETFTDEQRKLGTGPTSPAHLLEPGELLERVKGFEPLFYEEVARPEAVARLVARKPSAIGV